MIRQKAAPNRMPSTSVCRAPGAGALPVLGPHPAGHQHRAADVGRHDHRVEHPGGRGGQRHGRGGLRAQRADHGGIGMLTVDTSRFSKITGQASLSARAMRWERVCASVNSMAIPSFYRPDAVRAQIQIPLLYHMPAGIKGCPTNLTEKPNPCIIKKTDLPPAARRSR